MKRVVCLADFHPVYPPDGGAGSAAVNPLSMFQFTGKSRLSILTLLGLILSVSAFAADTLQIDRMDPPSWFAGHPWNQIQLIVYGDMLAGTHVTSMHKEILIEKVEYPENPNYLFVNLKIDPKAQPGNYTLAFSHDELSANLTFPLHERLDPENNWQGFNAGDAIYLLMPDRFANGDPSNDSHPQMLEKADRSNPDGRHGGDITGIRNHLDYIAEMGFTALWINPLVENNMPSYSYHGYAATDFYRIDPRFGSNDEYRTLVKESHQAGLKVIMDMVFNHCATEHWFIRDLPMSDWINQWDTPTKSNFRGEVKADPYASEVDITRMENGWFDATMADLNQRNPYVMRYLTQNSIWWIEYAGIDAIRMDTYPYPDKDAMAIWADTIQNLYPGFTVLGETWLQRPAHTAYWQDSQRNKDGYRSHVPVVTDFPLHYAIIQAMNEEEGWTEGLLRLYYILSQDILYPDPANLVCFLDNHDLNRFFTSIHEDSEKFMMAAAFLLTTRRIPQVYYGTEIGMTGEEHTGHGFIREDFPGGWSADSVNAFTREGLSPGQRELQEYLKTLLNWRKENPWLAQADLLHFIPEDQVYVYFRMAGEKRIMVIINKNDEYHPLNLSRYTEGFEPYVTGQDIYTKNNYTLTGSLNIPPRSALILQLEKE